MWCVLFLSWYPNLRGTGYIANDGGTPIFSLWTQCQRRSDIWGVIESESRE